jgi:hypothetical protein
MILLPDDSYKRTQMPETVQSRWYIPQMGLDNKLIDGADLSLYLKELRKRA